MHDWELSVPDALLLQAELKGKVDINSNFDTTKLKTVAGIDASYIENQVWCAVCVLSFPDLRLLEQVAVRTAVTFPYIPGLFSFREGPAVLNALTKLKIQPDLMIFDAQGYAHPRRLGLASHIGVYLDRPSIGCAKTRLIGNYEQPGPAKGDYTYLTDPESENDEIVGAVLRTKENSKPLFISIGHRIDLTTSIKVVTNCLREGRLPEPTRLADRLANTKLENYQLFMDKDK